MTLPGPKFAPSFSRLFLRFAVFGLIGLIIISFLLFQIWMRTFEERLVRESREITAKYINAAVGHLLTEEDFRGVKKGPDWDSFRARISDLFSLPDVVRVKIFSREGELIWTDARELLEMTPSPKKNPHLLNALAGRVEANMSRLQKEEHRFERGRFRTLMELYVPIYMAGVQKPVGVAEIYLNVDPLFVTIRQTGWLIGLTVVGGLGLLLFISYIGLGRAVALILKQNSRLREALDEIYKATRLKDDILADLSREVRNPQAIMSYANLLSDGAFRDQPGKVRKADPFSQRMRNTAAEILSHFARIVELSRLKVGDVRPHREPVDVTEVLRDTMSDLSFFCGNGAVTCRLEAPPRPVFIHSDRGLVQQAIFNLVSNAVKFTPQGEVCVRLEKEIDTSRVKIVVEDTGIGIEPEELPLIFKEFYRGNHPEARFKSGVGLGLAIAKKSIELLGGRIDVESVYGKGSRFSVVLPNEFQ